MEEVNRIILGKEKEIREIMLAFLANGHVLLEDVPGVGKTTLALAFSRALKLEYRRDPVYAGCPTFRFNGLFHLPAGSGTVCLSTG